MIKTYDENKIATVPNCTNLTDFTTFIDMLLNGHYCMTVGAANTEAIGLPRSTSIIHVDVQSVNFVQVELKPFNTPAASYRLYKVSGTWGLTWTEV